MKYRNLVRFSTAAVLVAATAQTVGADAPDGKAAAADAPQAENGKTPATTAEAGAEPTSVALAAARPPIYVPPRLGAPKTRVGGGTRSGGATGVEVALLAPEHTGFSADASPTLYWWLSRDYEGEFEFVVMDRAAVAPTLRIRRSQRLSAGIHAIDLRAEGIELEPGVAYQWSVAIIRDPDRRSRDIAAVATLQHVEASFEPGDPAALASAGLWYDAMEAVSAPSATRDRAALLEQVALPHIAQWDRAAN